MTNPSKNHPLPSDQVLIEQLQKQIRELQEFNKVLSGDVDASYQQYHELEDATKYVIRTAVSWAYYYETFIRARLGAAELYKLRGEAPLQLLQIRKELSKKITDRLSRMPG